MVTFLTIVGVLSGVLGERVQRTAGDLARTERELDRVRVDNDAILRHLATGILTVDAAGLVGYVNPAAEQVLGVRAADLQGKPVGEALPTRLAALRQIVQTTKDRGRGRARAELDVTGATGRSLPLGVSTNVLKHEGQLMGVVAVFQDLTDVRDMERRVRRNETLAEVGALAAGIAHELRNGLKPISGSVEVLQRELKLDGESADLMALIARESARLNKFVTDLLSYSRERDLALEPGTLDDHLRELVGTLRHDPRRTDGVRVECPPGPSDGRCARPGRRRADPAGVAQPGRQRPRGAGRARHAHGDVGGSRCGPGGGGVPRRRTGHSARGPASRRGTLFHNQAGRHGPGAGDRTTDRRAPRWRADPRERGRSRHHGPGDAARAVGGVGPGGVIGCFESYPAR